MASSRHREYNRTAMAKPVASRSRLLQALRRRDLCRAAVGPRPWRRYSITACRHRRTRRSIRDALPAPPPPGSVSSTAVSPSRLSGRTFRAGPSVAFERDAGSCGHCRCLLPRQHQSRVGPGWDAFPQARRVRDRITHPPRLQAFDADQADAEALLKTPAKYAALELRTMSEQDTLLLQKFTLLPRFGRLRFLLACAERMVPTFLTLWPGSLAASFQLEMEGQPSRFVLTGAPLLLACLETPCSARSPSE